MKKIQLVQESKEVPVTHWATVCSTDTVYTTVLVGHPVTFECAYMSAPMWIKKWYWAFQKFLLFAFDFFHYQWMYYTNSY